MNIILIGCGGVGSLLLPVVAMLLPSSSFTLVDGDILEEKNLSRQLFDPSDIGKFKSVALADKRGHSVSSMASVPEFWNSGIAFDLNINGDTLILCAVDNHVARKEALEAADTYGATVICGANETTSSEAFIYKPGWKGTRLDPRVIYPEINTDNSDDPRDAQAGCTGHALTTRPQLVTANFAAAALMGHLITMWFIEAKKTPELEQYYPTHIVLNATGVRMDKRGVIE